MSRTIVRTLAIGATSSVVAAALAAAPASAHVGVTWASPQPPQLGKTSLIQLVVPHGCSFTQASLTTPDATGQTTLQKLGLGEGYTPADVNPVSGSYRFATTSVQVAIPRIDVNEASALGVNAGAVTAQFMPGSGWTTSVSEADAAATVVTFAATSPASALPYHDFMQFGIRMKIETKKEGSPATYTTPASSQLMLLTKQGCSVTFSNGTDTVVKEIYAGNLLTGWGTESPKLNVGLDPLADLTKGPKGDPGAAGPKGDPGAAGPKGDTGAAGTAGTVAPSRWAGDFDVARSSSKVVIDIDSSRRDANKTYAVKVGAKTVAAGRLNSRGDAVVTISGKKLSSIARNSTYSLSIGAAAGLAADKA